MFGKIKESFSDMRYYAGLRREWRRATTVPELGERGAAWCRGELGAHPYGYDTPMLETKTLLPVLQRANEAGLFTYQSQPGGAWDTNEGHVEQRAFVEGFLERDQLEGFRQCLESAGMLVLDSLAHDEPLVRYDGEDEVGGRNVARIDGYMNHISSAARRSLRDAADLSVIDLVWGRERALWDALDRWVAAEGTS